MRKFLVLALFILLGGFAFLYFWTAGTPPAQQNDVQTAFTSFFPVGKERPDTSFPEDTPNVSEQANPESALPGAGAERAGTALAGPAVAGFFLSSETTPEKKKVDVLRYVRRENGFVHEARGGGAPLQISNIEVPNIYEAYFTENGKGVLVRFLRSDEQTIATYYVPIPEPDPTGVRTQKQGVALRDNIVSIAPFADGKQIAMLTDENGENVVRIANPNGTKEQVFFKYPFKDWLLLASRFDLYLQTKALSSFEGALFKLSKNDYSKLVRNTAGFTALPSPSGTYILGSASTENAFSGFFFNTKTNKTTSIAKPILPEKCVWIGEERVICAVPRDVPSGNYPEDWYLGIVHFADDIAFINPTTGSIELKQVPGSFDITQPQYSPETNTLYFIEKASGSLLKFTL